MVSAQTSTLPAPAARHDTLARRVRKNGYFYLFVSPFFLFFAVFNLFPILFSLVISFSDWQGTGPIRLIGVRNYVNLLTNNDDFRQAVGNTLVLLIGSRGALILIALLVAYLLYMLRPRFDHAFRVTYFLPLLVSTVAVAQIFVALFDQQSGLANYVLSLLTGKRVAIGWLYEEAYGKPLVTMLLWWHWIGWTVVVLVASMEAIPGELHEAARVDGAGGWAIFWHVVLPLLRPIMLFVTVTSIIGGFQMFAEVFAIWGSNNPLGTPMGGPNNTAMTTNIFLYQVAFAGGRYGFGAAVSWLMFLMIAVFSFINYRTATRGAFD